MDTFTCGQCGRQFENKNLLKQFRVVKLGKDFCSSGCEKAYERDHAKETKNSSSDRFPTGANASGPKRSSSDSFSSGANAHPIYQKSDSEIQADLEEKRMDHEQELLEEKLAHDREMAEQQQKHELKLENIRSVSDAVERIINLDFGGEKPSPEIISKQVEFCFTIASSHISETFDVGGMKNLFNKAVYAEEKEKLNQSEKVVNAAIKKAELGVNKLRLCEPIEKALNFYNIYKDQLNDVKVKQIERKWDHKVLEAKPAAWVMLLCCMMVPFQLYVIYKLIELYILLPKKRKAEIAIIK